MVRVKVKKKGIRKNLNRNSNNKLSQNDSNETQEPHAKTTSYPLLRRFVSTSTDFVDPTPLLQSAPPSSANMKNDAFEPTPLCTQSMSTNMRYTAIPVTSNHNIVPCDNGGYITTHHLIGDDSTRSMGTSSTANSNGSQMLPSTQHQRQHHYSKRRLSQFANIDLDLDTIFDDDNSSSRCNINNNYKPGKKYIDGGNSTCSSFNPFAMDNAYLHGNFHMVDESVPGAVKNRPVGIH